MSESPENEASFLRRLFGRRPRRVVDPEKELRFTRSHQAAHFFMLTAVLLMLGLGILAAMFSKWGPDDPDFLVWWWLCLIPLPFAALSLRTALHCIRHAYLILSPLGVEIFPFFRPQKNFHVVFWSEIHSAEFLVSPHRLVLHADALHTGGTIVSLGPISPARRILLKAALDNRLIADNRC